MIDGRNEAMTKELGLHLLKRAQEAEAFAEKLADALARAITRNPLLSLQDWERYNDLLARYAGAKA